jgi:hypothetical protein
MYLKYVFFLLYQKFIKDFVLSIYTDRTWKNMKSSFIAMLQIVL